MHTTITTPEELAALLKPESVGSQLLSDDPDAALRDDLLQQHSHYSRGVFSFNKNERGQWAIYIYGKALPWVMHVHLWSGDSQAVGMFDPQCSLFNGVQWYDSLWQAVMVTESPRLQEIVSEAAAATDNFTKVVGHG